MTTIVIISFAVGVPILLYSAGQQYHSAKKIYELIWDINIPVDFMEKFHYSSPRDFHGGGDRYTVYETARDFLFMSRNNSIIRQSNKFSDVGISDMGQIEQCVQRIRENADLPEEYNILINESDTLEVLIEAPNKTLVIIHFNKIQQVHFVENIK
jgi:hypothetical protein